MRIAACLVMVRSHINENAVAAILKKVLQYPLLDALRNARRSILVLERLYLTATSEGLSLQPISQLLEVDKVGRRFAKLFRAGGVPMVAFRLGYADSSAKPTPRRALEDLLR